MGGRYQVTIEEYDLGWGAYVEEYLYFETEELAKQYCEVYNANRSHDWPLRAIYNGFK